LNTSPGGTHFTFLRGGRHHTVLVANLADNGSRIVNLRPLSADDHSNVPFAWTRDSRQVIFLSRRTQVLQVYSQPVDGTAAPRLLTLAPGIDFEGVRLAPDGEFLIAKGRPRDSEAEAFYRVPIGGGVPRLLFAPKVETCGDFRCTNGRANFCAYQIQSPDHKELIIKSFEPAFGDGSELLRIPEPEADYHWALSPDGSQIGLLKSEWGSNEIRFLSIPNGESHSIRVKDHSALRSLDWAPDSRSVFVGSSSPSGSALLRIDLNGKAQTIWQQSQPLNTWGVASPDGHHLAIFSTNVDANVWLVDPS
jgi:hypothetical protein